MLALRVQGLLQAEGMDCLIKNQNLSAAMGELPINECWPQVWIMDDRDYDRAISTINACLDEDMTNLASWHCSCGEKIPGQFSACWQCGEEKA